MTTQIVMFLMSAFLAYLTTNKYTDRQLIIAYKNDQAGHYIVNFFVLYFTFSLLINI